MFTGIVETTGIIEEIQDHSGNKTFMVSSAISNDLKTDQSVMHNGVCLTVEEDGKNGLHRVTAIQETLKKTMLSACKKGDALNLERSMTSDGRVDGHFVQGHVDTCGTVSEILDLGGSREYHIHFPEEFENLIVPQGSICLNGISLTVSTSNPEKHTFGVSIIPFTLEITNLKHLQINDRVNLEFDIIGKYINKIMSRLTT